MAGFYCPSIPWSLCRLNSDGRVKEALAAFAGEADHFTGHGQQRVTSREMRSRTIEGEHEGGT